MSRKPNEQSLIPDIPPEIRAARIGTCFNSITRKLMDKKIPAIDPERLPDKAVVFLDNKGKMQLKVNSTADTSTEGSFFGMAGKVKTGCILCSTTINFKASVASVSATNYESLNCYCSYVYSDQILRLYECSPKVLFNYMDEEFQIAYSAVINSTNAREYLKNYMNFVRDYGHGCVTELYLTSGSAFVIDVDRSDYQSINNYKYGGSICVSTPWGSGGSVASEFAKDITKNIKKAGMQLTAEQMPQNTPTQGWCNDLMAQVTAAGFEKLAEQPQLIKPYSGKEPVAPDIPKGTPSKKDEPKGKEIDITEDLQKEIMQQDNFIGTWDEYVKEQWKAYDELSPSKAVLETLPYILQETNFELTDRVPLSESDSQAAPTIEMENANAWNLGGYIPYSYKITPWSLLFPDLSDVQIPITFTSIYVAKIYIYYLTRVQFASYLYFLADVDPVNDSDAKTYKNACDEFLRHIEKTIDEKVRIDQAVYNELVMFFENKIKNLQPPHFWSQKVYTTFFKNYEFFVDNAYGFVIILLPSPPQRMDECYFIGHDQWDKTPNPFRLLTMLKELTGYIQLSGEMMGV